MKELTVLRVRIGSLAGFYAAGFGIVGFWVSLLHAMGSSLNFGVETSSLLKGLAFGVTAGVLQVVYITTVYAVLGALTGFFQAIIFNLIAGTSGGIVLSVKEQK